MEQKIMEDKNKNSKVDNVNQSDTDRLTLIEDALLDSVSGGTLDSAPICVGHQFCELPPEL